MKSAVENLTPTRAKLSVEVPFEELKPSLDAAYQKIAQQINVPGFRRGKVPPQIIDKQVGRDAVIGEAVNEQLQSSLVEAIREEGLTPLSQPEVDDLDFGDDKPLTFSAEFDTLPEFEIPDTSGLTATVDDIEVSDADVEEQIQGLRERFATLIDVERPAADGDFVVMDMKAVKDGETVEGADITGFSYQVGRGGMIDGLDEALTGMSAGEEKTFTSQLAGGDLVGQDVDIEVKVSQVQEQELPDLDDEFAEMASEFESMDELTADLRERITRTKRLEQAAAARDAVLEAMLDEVEIPVPEGIVTDELNARRQSMEQQLAMAGMSMEKYLEDEGQTQEEFEAELDRRVRDSVVAQFVLDRIAEEGEFQIEQQELTEHMVQRAQQAGQDPQEYVNHMLEHNHLPEVIGEIRRGKALASLVEDATVTDRSGNVVELTTLQPDGTYADPAEQVEGEDLTEISLPAGEGSDEAPAADADEDDDRS